MSTAAAWGPHGDGPGQCPAPGGSASVASWQAPPLDQGGGAGLREIINFLTGIALASPLSSPQQPVGQVWYRGLAHQKPDGRSPPRLIIAPAVSPATGGTNSATVWEHTICPVFTGEIACCRRSEWPGSSMRLGCIKRRS